MSEKKDGETECFLIDRKGGPFVFHHQGYTVLVVTSARRPGAGVHLERSRISNFLPQKRKLETFSLPLEEAQEIVRLAEESDKLKKEALKKARKLRRKFGV